jgi:hypothetical protein
MTGPDPIGEIQTGMLNAFLVEAFLNSSGVILRSSTLYFARLVYKIMKQDQMVCSSLWLHTSRRYSPRMAGLHRFCRVAAGGAHSLLVTERAEVLAWGSNSHGQVGNASVEEPAFFYNSTGTRTRAHTDTHTHTHQFTSFPPFPHSLLPYLPLSLPRSFTTHLRPCLPTYLLPSLPYLILYPTLPYPTFGMTFKVALQDEAGSDTGGSLLLSVMPFCQPASLPTYRPTDLPTY